VDIGKIVFVQSWYMVRAGIVEDALAIEGRECVSDHEDGIRWVAIHGFEHSVKIVGLPNAERLHGDPERYS